jgi:hypothetical protein
MTGASNCEFNGTTDYGRAFLPSIGGQGFDENLPGYGSCSVFLPSLFAYGETITYIPAEPQFGLGFLPQPYAIGHMIASSSGEANILFPSLMAVGGEGYYGYGNALFPALMASGVDDFAPKTAFIFSSVRVQNGILGVSDHIVFIDNNGLITGTITATRQAVESFIERLSLSSDFSVIGSFYALIDGRLSVVSGLAGQLVGRMNFDETSRVWVVNMDTGASSQYDNYGFNSFFERDGEHYGVAEGGIYKLEGTDDAGTDIDALIEMGRSDLGSPHKKKVINVYAGVSSTGKMLLKVDADGQTYIYEARSSSTAVSSNRFDIGRGLSGNYYNFTLMNQDGNSFDLETVIFEPVVMKRKI